MPRKQRFKPSRKPKPVPVNEDAVLSHHENGGLVHGEKSPMRESVQSPADDSNAEGSSQSG
jgi:hypothetical protein